MKITLLSFAAFALAFAVSWALENLRQHYRRHPGHTGFYGEPDQVPDGWVAIVQDDCPEHGYAPHQAAIGEPPVCILCHPLRLAAVAVKEA